MNLSSSHELSLGQWAREWRGPMLRFALLHIQPREEAEDAVQDALAAMLGTVRPRWGRPI